MPSSLNGLGGQVPWLLLLATLQFAESGLHPASIKSKYGQLVTSSTLRWTDADAAGVNPSQEAVPSGTGNADKFVCRAEHHGALLVGQTTELGSYCVVGFVNRLYKKRHFELLVNVDRSARLEWRPYSRYAGVPEGSVAAVDESSASVVGDHDIFIGRQLCPSSSAWLPGSIEVPRRSANFGLMRVFDAKGNMSEQGNGDILVEIEPIRYELEIHASMPDDEPRRTRKVVKADTELAKSSLFRFDEGKDIEARMQKVLSYEYEKSEYYGQVPGMLRALPTSIRLPNGQVQSVLWGLAEKSQQHETIMVGHALQHFRAVDVSVVGVRITEETPYRGTLSAIFPDGSRRQRQVDGVVQRIYLDNIRPEYSRVYRIKEATNAAVASNTLLTTEAGRVSTRRPPSKAYFPEKGGVQLKDSPFETRDRQTAKDRILSEHQLLMASSPASSSASKAGRGVLLSFGNLRHLVCLLAFFHITQCS